MALDDSSLSRSAIAKIVDDLEVPPDLEEGCRLLAGLLAKRHAGKVTWQSYVGFQGPGLPCYVNAFVQGPAGVVLSALRSEDSSNDHQAHLQSQFFALRHAAVGERAVCGKLLDMNGVVAILKPPSEGDVYDLQILVGPRQGSPLQTSADGVYRLKVRLESARTNGRTRYLRVSGVHAYPDLANLLRSRMKIDNGNPIRLHRVIAALAGANLHARGNHGQEQQIHVHHLNGVGFDCRWENLTPLPSTRHRQQHRAWAIEVGLPLESQLGPHAPDLGPGGGSLYWGEWNDTWFRDTTHARHIDRQRVTTKPASWGFFGSASRKDRRRSLDRLAIAIHAHGGCMAVDDLVHALLLSPCDSKSGIRKVIIQAVSAELVESFFEGRRQTLFLRATLVTRFRRRVILNRMLRIRQLRLANDLENVSRWFHGKYSRRKIAPYLRRVWAGFRPAQSVTRSYE